MPPVGKIATLPDELRAWLHRAIVERGYGDIVGLTDELNALCKQGGVAITIGKSAVGAESQRIKRAAESLRATTEAARVIAEQARDDADLRGEAVIAMIQEGTFDALMLAREAEQEDDPFARIELMGKAALAASRVSRARLGQAKWRDELDTRAKAAAEAVAKQCRAGGLSDATVDEIYARVLGVANISAARAQANGA